LTLEAMQWKWKACEHSAVNRACPCPARIAPKQIAQVLCLEDLPLPDLESFRLEAEETISRVPEAADAVELVAASENRPVGSASSTVLGAVRQRSFSFTPRAIFTFLQAPDIFPSADRIGTLTRVFPGTNEEKSEKG